MKVSTSPRYQVVATEACKNPTTTLVRGVLHTPVGSEHGRIAASHPVAEYVEHYWWARWRLDAPRSAEVLTYPSVHVVFEGDEERIVGVVRAKFVRRLVGQGEVFGIKFRPGMFRPLSKVPVHRLTDRAIPHAGELGAGLGGEIRSQMPERERVDIVERALRRALPEPPSQALLARDLIDRIRTEPALRSIAALTIASGLSERALQRLFREFVGVSPKWVICRFRLQEAAELLAASEDTVASVAASLGYFDQAHFARDFKSVVGQSPIAFVAQSRMSVARHM